MRPYKLPGALSTAQNLRVYEAFGRTHSPCSFRYTSPMPFHIRIEPRPARPARDCTCEGKDVAFDSCGNIRWRSPQTPSLLPQLSLAPFDFVSLSPQSPIFIEPPLIDPSRVRSLKVLIKVIKELLHDLPLVKEHIGLIILV